MKAFCQILVLGMICGTGCGTAGQAVVGWSSEQTNRAKQDRKIAITSSPVGARVSRRGADGSEAVLGSAPLFDSFPVEVETKVLSPSNLVIWIGAALELVAGGAMILVDEDQRANDFQFENDEEIGTLGAVGALVVISSLVDFGVAIVREVSGDEVGPKRVVSGGGTYEYIGRSSGGPDRKEVIDVAARDSVHFAFDGKGPPAVALPPVVASVPARPTPAAATPGTDWVIAVMGVVDSNAGQGKALGGSLLDSLGDQMRIFVAQRGVRTVDRGTQEKALKEQIDRAKAESYKNCYDDSCQVELGKALAASHILRTRVSRFGKKCVLNGELIDLKSEVTVAAASSQGDCSEEGFLNMGEEVARNLIRAR